MKLHFQEQAFSFELLRAVTYAGYQGAERGEVLATAVKKYLPHLSCMI